MLVLPPADGLAVPLLVQAVGVAFVDRPLLVLLTGANLDVDDAGGPEGGGLTGAVEVVGPPEAPPLFCIALIRACALAFAAATCA